MNRWLAVAVAVVVVLSACYALGLFDGDGVTSVEDKDFDEFTFSGDMRNGRFDGFGVVSFPEGESYRGNFADGRFDGEGAFSGAPDNWDFYGVFQIGMVGDGTLHMDGETLTLERAETTDTLVGADWRFYGRFGEAGQSGVGTFVFADGSVYAGAFVSGVAEGEGTYTDAYGRVIYTGGFKGGLFDGPGKYFSAEGWSYEGGFSGGLFHGEGAITIGSETIRGVWEKGVQTTRYD